MAVTVDDIKNKQFTTRSRGYDKFEVDTFLEDIIIQLEQSEGELEELRRKCSSLYETINVYKQTEDSMKEILVIAKSKSDELVAKANAQAEEIVAEARKKADEAVGGMDFQVEQLRREGDRLKAQHAEFKEKLGQLLRAQMESLEEFGKEQGME